jgi:hypothetical protein
MTEQEQADPAQEASPAHGAFTAPAHEPSSAQEALTAPVHEAFAAHAHEAFAARAHEAFAARLIKREALRRAAMELATTTPAGLESALARISAEVTADAAKAKVDSAKDG